MFKSIKGQGGFSLIELCAVIIIVAILAAVAIPRFVNLADEAKDAKVAELQGIANAQEQAFWAEVTLNPSLVTTVPSGFEETVEGYIALEMGKVLGDPSNGANGSVSCTPDLTSGVTAVTITYGDVQIAGTRTPATDNGPGSWTMVRTN